jgi:hypothetical protein
MAYEVTDSNGPLRNRRHPAWWTNVNYDAIQPRPTADLEKGVHNFPEVLNELEEMSASELKSLLTLSTDPSVVGLHTAAQMEVVHERIRGCSKMTRPA